MQPESSPRILMCPPDYFGIEYEINPWMNVQKGSDALRARQQWDALYRNLLDLDVAVELIEPVKGLPDLVFTANCGLVYENLFISSRFRYGVRQGEAPYFETLGARARFRGRDHARAVPLRRGRRCALLRRDLDRGLSLSQRRAQPPVDRRADLAGKCFLSSWSTRGFIISTPASARSRRTSPCFTPARSTNTASRCLRDRIPASDRGRGRGGDLV